MSSVRKVSVAKTVSLIDRRTKAKDLIVRQSAMKI